MQAEVRREALRLTGNLLRGCSSASTRREVPHAHSPCPKHLCHDLAIQRGLSGFAAQVLQAAADRLLDTDERVRIAAIEGIADAAQAGLTLLEGAGKPLAAVAERLRDVKPAVVKKAAEKLLWVFKTYAVQRDQGTIVSTGASEMQAHKTAQELRAQKASALPPCRGCR